MAQSESPKTANLTSREVEGTVSSEHRDEADLARLGKRSVLKVRYIQGTLKITCLKSLFAKKRSFGFMAVLGFSTTILITWEGLFT